MNLIQNWQQIATKAWSSRLAWLAAGASGMEVALPSLQILIPETFISPGSFAMLALVISAAGGVARLVQQPKLAEKIAESEACKP